MHEMFIQTDSKVLSQYHKMLKFKQSAVSIKKSADTAKLKFTLIDNLSKSLPDENELDRFEVFMRDAENQIKTNRQYCGTYKSKSNKKSINNEGHQDNYLTM